MRTLLPWVGTYLQALDLDMLIDPEHVRVLHQGSWWSDPSPCR